MEEMEVINGRLKKWELAEAVFVAVAGTLLHYVYEWSGNNRFAGIFAPVNESVFEHLKLVFLPVLLFTLLEYAFLKEICSCLLWVKWKTVLGSMAFIVIFFYCYTGMLQKDVPWLDIGSFYVAAVLNSLWTYRALSEGCGEKKNSIPAAWMWVILAVLIIWGTIYPPVEILPGLFCPPV